MGTSPATNFRKNFRKKKGTTLGQLHSVEEFLEHFPTVKEVIVDGTERPIARPKDAEKQKENYSGKKKRCTRKSLVASGKDKRILVLTPTTSRKTYDEKIQDQENLIGGIPDEIPVLVDSGFQGVQKQYVNIRLPHKKLKGGELIAEQKQENRELAEEMVVGENAFAGVKRYKAVSDIYKKRVFWGASHFCKSTKLVFLKGNSLLKLGVISNFIAQSKPLGGTSSPNRWFGDEVPPPNASVH
jgi:hypothetical protein